MAAKHIGGAGVAASALLAVLLLLIPASPADASCSRENRVSHRDAECLSASWKNRGLLRKSPYSAQNMCPAYGKVVAKVDLVSASDRTLHLDGGDPREGNTSHRIRGIYCCSDLSTLCNRSDLYSDAGCARLFERESPAARTCRGASATYSSENRSCTVSAECRGRATTGHEPAYRDTRITVPVAALAEVHNCDGWLHDEACDRRPLGLSVANARVEEAEGATLDFVVTLSRPYWQEVSVLYSTSDGTARQGSDYWPQTAYLRFAPGETEKTVSVHVLDDVLDEGQERMWLSLAFPHPMVRLTDPAGMGTIVNSDRMPRAWIARFGRTVADQVLDAVDVRMRARPATGVEAHLAGQRIDLGPSSGPGSNGNSATGPSQAPEMQVAGQRALRDLAGWPHDSAGPVFAGVGAPPASPGHRQAATERDLLLGSSFSLTAETDGEGSVSVWGAGAATRFSGRDAQAGADLAVEGEVASGLLGADWTRGDWTAGLIVSRNLGDGGYRGTGGGTVSAALTGVWPWVGHALGERLSLWGVAGYGEGNLSLEPRNEDGTHAGAIKTGMDLVMAAAGLRAVALDGGSDGVTLAVKTDTMIVQTASDAASGAGGNLAAAEAEVTRLGLGLEGSRPFRLGDGSALTPDMEIGVRHDGGDAETGFGADIGARIAWRDAERGLAAVLRGRGLLTHESKGFRERALSASFAWDPATDDRGPRLSLTRTLGVAPDGGDGALPGGTTLPELATNEDGDALQRRRLEARLGYGLSAFGDRVTVTPEIAVGLSDAGRDYSLGWRLTHGSGVPDDSALELAIEVRRRETAADRSAPPEHAVGVRATSRF